MGCVIWALKAHFINISETLPDREEIIEALTGKQSPLCYTRPIRQALLQQAIVVPDTLKNGGITIRDIGELEKTNEVPIVVYYLDYTPTPKQRKTREQAMKTKAKRGGDPYDTSHYMRDVTLTCIRAPSQKILRRTVARKQRKTREQAMKTNAKRGGDPYVTLTCIRAPSQKILRRYTKPPCHLLMIGPKHVCYIPNIQEYMLQVVDRTFRDLLTHLKSGNCYKKCHHPLMF